MRSRWTIRVPILPDELFSSWLVRLALTHGCDPLVVTGQLWPRWRMWTQDPDRGLRADRLISLTEASGIDAARIQAAFLDHIVMKIAPGAIDTYATWPWVLALGTRNRRRHGGLQYCPACLADDQQPYFRRQWRMVWHTSCGVHQIGLLDRCCHCKGVIAPHLLCAEDTNLAVCAHCKTVLTDQRAHLLARQIVEPDAVLFQSLAERVVNRGRGRYGSTFLPIEQWFVLARYFITLVRKVSTTKSDGLRALVEALGMQPQKMISPMTGLPLEMLPTVERASLLGAAALFFKIGPRALFREVKAAQLTRATLCDRRIGYPACLESLFASLPNPIRYHHRISPTQPFKPKSDVVVMRKWARLQRKLLTKAGRV